mmetsp:Transcript_13437/g.31846  ORF Transcript_13437/g.31846 Transcript_13437/m.31846 type:complete len:176 (+) Transcript_13437:56-583(+)
MGQASCSPIVLPGDLKEGDFVFYAAPDQQLPSGYWLKYGVRGQVTGPADVKDGRDAERVAVKFPDQALPVACFANGLSTKMPPKELEGGWIMGEHLVYIGAEREEHGQRLCSGMRCEVVGPGSDGKSVAVHFAGLPEPLVTANVVRPTDLRACPAACAMEVYEMLRAQPEKVQVH